MTTMTNEKHTNKAFWVFIPPLPRPPLSNPHIASLSLSFGFSPQPFPMSDPQFISYCAPTRPPCFFHGEWKAFVFKAGRQVSRLNFRRLVKHRRARLIIICNKKVVIFPAKIMWNPEVFLFFPVESHCGNTVYELGLGRICFFAECRISGRIIRHAMPDFAGHLAFSCWITRNPAE